MTDLVIGKGRLYFEPFIAGTRRRSGSGFHYFGNTPKLTLQKSTDKVEHFSSEGGLKVKDASVETSETSGGSFDTDHISMANLAFWYRGNESSIQQLAGAAIVETWPSVKRGNYFQLGETVATPQGARNVSNVSINKGTVAASGTVTLSTAVPVNGDNVTVNGVVYTFRAAPVGPNDVLIGATLAATASNLADAINADDATSLVHAVAAAAIVTITAKAKGTAGNAYTLAKVAATAGNIAVSGATLAGGAQVAIGNADANYRVNGPVGLVRVLADANDIDDGDSISITYDQAAVDLSVVIAGTQMLEGRLMFVADNGHGENKDHLWPYVQLTSDGDYSLIGDDWQTLGFKYDVLKLDDDTEREIVTNRG